MISRPINYIFLEGPDLSGKTTFYENIHKSSSYRWNIQDRSALSMLVHAKFYGRDAFRHVEQLKEELYNLNNILIILLPTWSEIGKRFNLRGDPIQNITSLKKIYELFSEAADELENLPNVIVIRSIADSQVVKYTIKMLMDYENSTTEDIQKNCMIACYSKDSKEVIGLNFTLYDNGKFSDIDEGHLLYEKEVEYYEDILNDIKEKIKKEMAGENHHNRKETFESRRFIYNSETCISLAHFLLRKESLDCKFFIRSSNVKDTLFYDLNFLKHMSKEVYNLLNVEEKFCRMKFTINSGHILEEEEL